MSENRTVAGLLSITNLAAAFFIAAVIPSSAQVGGSRTEGDRFGTGWSLPNVDAGRVKIDSVLSTLTLRGSTVTLDDTEVAPVTVSRPAGTNRFEVSTRLSFAPGCDGGSAGLDIGVGPRLHYEFGIRDSGAGREVYLRYVIGSVRTIAARQNIPPGPLRLRISVFPKYYRFAFAVGDGEFLGIGGVEAIKPDAGVIRLGLFASGNGRESTTPAEFDRFELNDSPRDPYESIVITDPSLPKGYTVFSVDSAEKGIIEKYPFITRPLSIVPADIEEKRAVVYRRYGAREMKLDLYRPKSCRKCRAAIIVHGGAWITGHYTMEDPLAIALARRGYVAATVEYRLSNEAKYPTQIHDLKSAVRWLRSNATKLGVDPRRIGAAGASSGGHLVALLGATNGLSKYEDAGEYAGVSSSVQSVVDIDGTATFVDEGNIAKEIKGPWDTNTKLTGFTYAENPEIWKEASPILQVHSKSAPTLFLNSSSFRPFQQREEMAAKLNSLGIASEIVVIPDTPHPFWLFRPWFDETVDQIDRFFSRIMGPR